MTFLMTYYTVTFLTTYYTITFVTTGLTYFIFLKWPIGKVQKLHPSSDGRIRVAEIQIREAIVSFKQCSTTSGLRTGTTSSVNWYRAAQKDINHIVSVLSSSDFE